MRQPALHRDITEPPFLLRVPQCHSRLKHYTMKESGVCSRADDVVWYSSLLGNKVSIIISLLSLMTWGAANASQLCTAHAAVPLRQGT